MPAKVYLPVNNVLHFNIVFKNMNLLYKCFIKNQLNIFMFIHYTQGYSSFQILN